MFLFLFLFLQGKRPTFGNSIVALGLAIMFSPNPNASNGLGCDFPYDLDTGLIPLPKKKKEEKEEKEMRGVGRRGGVEIKKTQARRGRMTVTDFIQQTSTATRCGRNGSITTQYI